MLERPTVKVEAFEGPLDLLLFLISKNKVSILDIPIVTILEQYNEYLNVLREDNIEVASDFLQMAARLVYIKSAMLLPKSDEGEELKAELAAELMEYQVCRLAAQKLNELAGFDGFDRQPTECDIDRTYRLKHEPQTLGMAFIAAAGRGKRRLPPKQSDFNEIVAKPIVSVVWGVYIVLKQLKTSAKVGFAKLFSPCKRRDQVVAVFVAMLELVKAGRVDVSDSDELKLRKGTKHGA